LLGTGGIPKERRSAARPRSEVEEEEEEEEEKEFKVPQPTKEVTAELEEWRTRLPATIPEDSDNNDDELEYTPKDRCPDGPDTMKVDGPEQIDGPTEVGLFILMALGIILQRVEEELRVKKETATEL
jgi:hypothetical protein